MSVKDINSAPKYTFKSKRCTNPMTPFYKYNHEKSIIDDNKIS